MLINALALEEDQIREIIENVLLEFPIKEIGISIPGWVNSLFCNHWLKSSIYADIKSNMMPLRKVRDVSVAVAAVCENEYIDSGSVISIDLGSGTGAVEVKMRDGLLYRIISESSRIEVADETALVKLVMETVRLKKVALRTCQRGA